MVVTTNPITEHVDGIIGRTNANGFTLVGHDGWLNRSTYADPLPSMPAEGATVRVGLDKAGYVRALELVPASATAPAAQQVEVAPVAELGQPHERPDREVCIPAWLA